MRTFRTIFVCLFISLPVYAGDLTFDKAVPGDIWEVDNFGFYREPIIPKNKFDWQHNTIGALKRGAKIEILDTQGFLEIWYKVLLYDAKTMKPIARGWVYGPGVKGKWAKRIIKSTISPFD